MCWRVKLKPWANHKNGDERKNKKKKKKTNLKERKREREREDLVKTYV